VKILLVEDCDADAKIFAAHCASLNAGLEVVRASSLVDAKSLCGDCDALMVDLHLPNTTIHETMEFLRSHRRKKPTVIYSADGDHETVTKMGRLDVGYLLKGAYHPRQILIEIYRSQGAILEWRDVRRRVEELIGTFERLLQDLSEPDSCPPRIGSTSSS
jgi:response regulator of citrate/malate metabolism